jgi:hypothetical protein
LAADAIIVFSAANLTAQQIVVSFDELNQVIPQVTVTGDPDAGIDYYAYWLPGTAVAVQLPSGIVNGDSWLILEPGTHNATDEITVGASDPFPGYYDVTLVSFNSPQSGLSAQNEITESGGWQTILDTPTLVVNFRSPLQPPPPIITTVNIGPAGGGNLTMSIQGSGFGTSNAFDGTSPYLGIIDVTPHSPFGPWEAGFTGDGVNLNVSAWTDTNIVINGFTGWDFNTAPYSLQAGDQLQVIVENPQTQTGFVTNTVTLNQGALVIDIQPPSGHPMMLNNDELAYLQNALLNQLQQVGLCQANSTPIAVYVIANPPSFCTGVELDLLCIAMDAPYSILGGASEVSEVGFYWGISSIAVDALGQDAANALLPTTSPVGIACDVAAAVYGSAQSAQALDLNHGTCWSFLNNPGQYQPQLSGYCSISAVECNEHVRMLIPILSLPTSTVDLRNILGNLFYGVVEPECGQLTVGCGLNGFGPVDEESYANGGGEGEYGPIIFTAQIIDVLGNPVSSPVVPTGPPDCHITIIDSPSDGGTNSGGGPVYSGTSVTVTATPNPCCSFQNWTENGVFLTTFPTYTFTATSSRNLTANFVTNLDTVTTTRSPSVGGTTTGANTVNCGDSITIVANPNLGYSFAGWTWNGNWVTNSSTFAFTVNANSNLVANFSPVGCSIITTIASPSSAGSASGGGLFTNGQSETLTATVSDSCYGFSNWTSNGTPVCDSTNYTFTVTTNQVFVANFAPIPYNIALSSSPSAGGTMGGGGAAGCGTNLTIYATPNSCYTFVNWTENGTVVSWFPYYTFTVGSAHNFVANFTPTVYSISASTFPSGSGTITGGGTVNCGDNETVVATANSGYTFLSWTENGNVTTNSPSYTFAPTGYTTLIANFVPNVPLLGFSTPLWNATGFNLTLQGPIGSNYEIDASTDLFNWLPLTNFTSTNSPQYFSDPTATNFNQQFYRALMQ